MRLRTAQRSHPWPQVLTIALHGEPVRYDGSNSLVVEIRADIATDHGRWRHALRFLRTTDLTPEDVALDLDLEA